MTDLSQSKQPDEKELRKRWIRYIIVVLLIGPLVICLLAGGLMLYYSPTLFNTAKPSAGDSPMNYLIINQGDWKCYPDNSGSIVFEGNVQNTSPYNIWNIVVGVALVNNSGVETSSNTGYADRVVGPNSEAHFQVVTYNENPSESYTCKVKVVSGSFK
jgi:hypothetical protein